MLEILLIILFFNICLFLYLFDNINGYNLIIIPTMLTKIILIYESDVYLFFSKYKLTKKINDFDDKLNKKCFFHIFNLFFKNNNLNVNNIKSKIILNVDSEEE
jgi:uncharacterized membrane protein YkvI